MGSHRRFAIAVMLLAGPAGSYAEEEKKGADTPPATDIEEKNAATTPPPADIYGFDYRDPWHTTVGLGTQVLPEYDEEGNSSGLSDQSFVALINIDSVWEAGKFRFLPFSDRVHFGGTLLLSGAPTQNAQLNTGDGGAMESGPCGAVGVTPGCFNDVDDVISFSAYLDIEAHTLGRTAVVNEEAYNKLPESNDAAWDEVEDEFYYRKDNGTCEAGTGKDICEAPTTTLGYTIRATVESRDQLGTDNDSAVWSVSLGGKVATHRYRAKGYLNGTPSGFTEFSVAFFEEFAGQENEVRYLFNAQRAFFGELPLYIGAFGNFGDGEDVFGISVVYLVKPEGFVELFSGNVRN